MRTGGRWCENNSGDADCWPLSQDCLAVWSRWMFARLALWAREIEKLGHQVRLINPRFVRPYVKANKNDASDAEAICEAAGQPSMRFVGVKSAAQQDVQAVHRVRQQLVKSRTALR